MVSSPPAQESTDGWYEGVQTTLRHAGGRPRRIRYRHQLVHVNFPCRTFDKGVKWGTASARACKVTAEVLETVADRRNDAVFVILCVSLGRAQLLSVACSRKRSGPGVRRCALLLATACAAACTPCIARAKALHAMHDDVHFVDVVATEDDEHGFR